MIGRFRACFFYAAVFLLAKSAFAAEWELRREEQGIKVYTRPVEGSPVFEFLGETVINVPVEKAAALYEDTEKLTQWFHRCKDARLLHQEEPDVRIIYFAADLPWPLHDRDGVYRQIKTTERDGTIRFQLSALKEGHAEQPHRVRVRFLDSEWSFSPAPGNKTEVRYRMHTETGGFIPPVLTNRFTVSLPFKSLRNLKRQLETQAS